MSRYRSPSRPPLTPLPPLPGTRSFWPSVTPFGTRTLILRGTRRRKPFSSGSGTAMSNSISVPLNACSNVRCTAASKSWPGRGAFDARRPPPRERPRKFANRSARSRSSNENCVSPNDCCQSGGGRNSSPGAWRPSWSYAARFSGSFSVSYASATSLNFSSASFSFETSGWYLRASLRYAALIWSAVARALDAERRVVVLVFHRTRSTLERMMCAPTLAALTASCNGPATVIAA